MAELTDEEKAAQVAAKAAAKEEAKSLIKEALSEFAKDNSPKARTDQPKATWVQQLFGQQ